MNGDAPPCIISCDPALPVTVIFGVIILDTTPTLEVKLTSALPQSMRSCGAALAAPANVKGPIVPIPAAKPRVQAEHVCWTVVGAANRTFGATAFSTTVALPSKVIEQPLG